MREFYERGGLSRRQFLQGLMAAGLTASTATAILTGSRDVRAETPKRGGRLRVASSAHGPTDTLDPQLFTDFIAYSRDRAHLNNLVQFNDDMSVRPELADLSRCLPCRFIGNFRIALQHNNSANTSRAAKMIGGT